MASLVISFPLLLLMTGGLIWIGMGLALAPVESIRRRVDTIAATDLSQRFPRRAVTTRSHAWRAR
jgi:hypothetical protein